MAKYAFVHDSRNFQFFYMKRLLLSLITTLAVLFMTPTVRAQAPKAGSEDPEFVDARKLFWSGRYEESEKKFRIYLLQHPGHEPSKNFLLMIAQSRKYNPSKIDSTHKRLAEIRVDKVIFKETEWRTVTSYLQDLANPKKNGEYPADYVNFINMLPSGFSRKVTLDLRDVSLIQLIEHICEKSDLRYVVDTSAVIFDIPDSKK